MIRHILGQGDGIVIGCEVCGEVQHLIEGQIHKCSTSSPFALTIDARQLKDPLPFIPPNP